MAAGAALAGLSSIRQDSEKLKKTLQGVAFKSQLGSDLLQLKAKFSEVGKSGHYSADAVKAVKREVGDLSAKARDAGLNVGKLHTELRKLKVEGLALNMQMTGNNLSAAGRNMRTQAYGQMTDAAASGYAIYKPLDVAARFEDVIKDIAITGDMTVKEEAALATSMRGLALKYNQEQHAVADGMKRLVETGMSQQAAQTLMPLLSKFATASRTDMGDSARMARSFELLGVKDMELAFNQAASAGKKGSFEVANMAKWFPALGGFMKELGVVGNEAVVSLAARMQIATRTAGSNDEAANNFKNFLSKLTSQDTIKDFKKQGIDLVGSLQASARRGVDPVAAGVEMVLQHVTAKAPEAAAELQNLAVEMGKIKDPAERAAELERRRAMIEKLGSRAAVGDLFQDLQAVSYLLAEMQNQGELKSLMNGVRSGKNDKGQSVIDADFARRMGGMSEQMRLAKNSITDLGISLGEAFMPAVSTIVPLITSTAQLISGFTQAHPVIAKVAGTMLVGFATASVLGFALKWLAGGALSVIGPMMSMAGWAIRLAVTSRTLGIALRFGAQAVLWLGRALLLNPIGLIITGIATAAYLVYRNWDKLGPMFTKGWATVKGAFVGAWTWIKALPGQFMDMGGRLIDGLIAGVTNKLSAAKATIVGFGQNIKGWFTTTLGIKSPSRVFMGFGANIGQGAEHGILNSVPGVKSAVGKLAGVALAGAAMTGGAAHAANGHPAAAGGVQITFSPTINVTGGSDVQAQVQRALQISLRELEQMQRRVASEQRRRAY